MLAATSPPYLSLQPTPHGRLHCDSVDMGWGGVGWGEGHVQGVVLMVTAVDVRYRDAGRLGGLHHFDQVVTVPQAPLQGCVRQVPDAQDEAVVGLHRWRAFACAGACGGG